MIQKFRTFRKVEKDTNCGNTATSVKCFDSYLAPILAPWVLWPCLGGGKLEGQGPPPCYGLREMIQEGKILLHKDANLSVYAMALGKRKISSKYI